MNELKRETLLCLGWLACAVGLWLLLLFVELYWNSTDWQPKVDWISCAFLGGIVLALASSLPLSQRSRGLASRLLAFISCVALFLLGLYVLPPEPLTSGLLGRSSSSPAWYRWSRLFVLSIPLLGIVRGYAIKHPRATGTPQDG